MKNEKKLLFYSICVSLRRNLIKVILTSPKEYSVKSDRLQRLSEHLRGTRYSRMDDLAREFGVSLATIHRDVQELVRRGVVKKVHGGATSLLPAMIDVTGGFGGGHFLQRMEMQRESKSRIAERAEAEIENGDIVFVDSSTTGMFLARRLQETRFANLSVVTNSVLVSQEFHRFPPHYILVCVGGNFNVHLNSFLGQLALDNLSRLQVTKAFVSCAGVSDDSLTTYHEEHAVFLRGVLAMARKKYLLVDRSKFGKTGLYEICSLAEIDQVISE